ncbi:Gfo/Idh/MocA family oxidoreductase (plasmid) [Polymorphobacter sp. PAMC 29334]|uniref:Gfo/Idh/MocA family protein n=1 Tax=Polymorphobacter sp. PAMC 29334 TaxID=2862331 RepID=UPI001C686931|nr:Gfo/Idh/MocA family oxidoreductase [Polymorphobacter sp. PAMC 29334]
MSKDVDLPNRRTVMTTAGAVGLGLAASANAATSRPPAVDAGVVSDGKVQFPPSSDPSDSQPQQPPNPDPRDKRVGFAVVGLGKLALEQILPAFAQAKHGRLAALVSGTPDKLRAIAAQYGIPADCCYGYDDFARISSNSAVEAVYVVTPNALHHRDVLAAAKAEKNVLCEKPMATTAHECRDMIAATASAKVRLMIAYRMQYQPHAREAIKQARGGKLGDVVLMDMINNQNQGDPAQWRQKRALAGGGSLPDVGLYCLNTARAILGEEPSEVSATIWSPAGDPRFAEVEDNVSFTLRFPSGVIANCLTSYGTHRLQRLKLMGTSAWLEMENAFAYEGQRLRVAQLVDGKEHNAELTIPAQNQFALEIDHFAQCIRSSRTPRTPGEEGLQDQVIIEAIYASAREGRPVKLERIVKRDAFRGAEPEAAD